MNIHKTIGDPKQGELIFSTWAKKEPKRPILDAYRDYAVWSSRRLILYVDDTVSLLLWHWDEGIIRERREQFLEYWKENDVDCIFSSEAIWTLSIKRVFEILSMVSSNDFDNLICSKEKRKDYENPSMLDLSNFIYNFLLVELLWESNTLVIWKKSLWIYYCLSKKVNFNLIAFDT